MKKVLFVFESQIVGESIFMGKFAFFNIHLHLYFQRDLYIQGGLQIPLQFLRIKPPFIFLKDTPCTDYVCISFRSQDVKPLHR